jgi:hypothetical protein
MLYYLVILYARFPHLHIRNMAEQSKVLAVVNDTMEVPLDTDWNGAVGIEYGPKGDNNAASTGTVVVEGSVSLLAWYALKIVLPDASKVDLLAAAGLGYVDATGYTKVRVRMSVAGTANGVRVWANQKRG